MRVLVLLFVAVWFIHSNTFSQSFTKEDMAKIKPFLEKGAKAKYDEHAGVLWIQSKPIDIVKSSSLESRNISMSIYFGVKKIDGKITVLPMHFKNTLEINGWIFMESISILYGTLKQKKEGTREKFSLVDNDVKKETLGGARVRETSDVLANNSIMKFLSAICNEPKPISIRYTGKDKYIEEYYGVFLGAFTKKFKPVLGSYEKLKAEFNKI